MIAKEIFSMESKEVMSYLAKTSLNLVPQMRKAPITSHLHCSW